MRQAGLILWSVLLCSIVRADFISPPTAVPATGVVIEKGKKGTQVTIQWTGSVPKKGGQVDKLGSSSNTIRDAGDGFGQVLFPVPDTSTNPTNNHTAKVKDYIQMSKDPGPISVLMLEAFVPAGPDFVQYPFLDYIASIAGQGVTIWVPDLYSSKDPNSNAVLYEAVNLSVYMASLPTFNLGDMFSVVNGTVSSLPGMIFGNSEFTFDPNSPNGFDNPSPYSGAGYVLSAHGNVVTPEPGSLILLITVLVGLGATVKCKFLS
jgi:hypothetical protein